METIISYDGPEKNRSLDQIYDATDAMLDISGLITSYLKNKKISECSILDIGCGSLGEAITELAHNKNLEKLFQNHNISPTFIGIDPLLKTAPLNPNVFLLKSTFVGCQLEHYFNKIDIIYSSFTFPYFSLEEFTNSIFLSLSLLKHGGILHVSPYASPYISPISHQKSDMSPLEKLDYGNLLLIQKFSFLEVLESNMSNYNIQTMQFSQNGSSLKILKY